MAAPDRIWLEPDCAPFGERGWSSTPLDDCDDLGCGALAVEYIRADLTAPSPALTDADVERAAKAGIEAAGHTWDAFDKVVHAQILAFARAALAAYREGR